MLDEETENNIKEIFDKFDLNRNGVLDKEEFYKVCANLIKSLAEGQTEEEIKKITEEAIEKFDLNKNGTIELNEFAQLMTFLINEKGLSIDDL